MSTVPPESARANATNTTTDKNISEADAAVTPSTPQQAPANAASYFVDRHSQSAVANKNVFIEADGAERSLTYAELADHSARMPEFLAAHNIRREDRVALLLLDQIEFPVIFWGCLKAGVIPVAVNTLLATDIYATILNDSRARALFVSAPLLPVVEPLLADHAHLQHIFVVGEAANPIGKIGKIENFDVELKPYQPRETLEVDADESAFWLYSSGSTGVPKGVRHVHSSLQFTADTYGRQVLDVREDDIVYSAAKFFFAYGLGNAMTFPMSVGATTVLFSGRPTPDVVLDILNTRNPTVFCGVPTLYAATNALLEQEGKHCSASLRRCISAGEALPEEIGRQWQQHTRCEVLDGVGSTELLHIFLSNAPGDVVYGTSGVAVPGYELRLIDENGDEVATGAVGELLVRGESAATDYWNQRTKSRQTFEGEWTRTGDKYERDTAGRYIYCGRTDDMFKVSGIWVSPFEVEQALVSHELVLEAAVVAARDRDDLEKPKAFVVMKSSGNTEVQEKLAEELKETVKTRIGKWKYPRWIEFVEELPKTATGKIQRFKLRENA